MKRILILSASHLCRNPRAVKEATALGYAGYEVTILTVSWLPRYEELDRTLAKDLPCDRVTLDFTARHFAARMQSVASRARTRLARSLIGQFGWESPHALGPAHALLNLARAMPADLTIAHTELPLWISTRLAAEGRKIGVDIEDWYSEDLLPSDRRTRPLRLLRETESEALRRAACSFTTSTAMAEALAHAFGVKPPSVVRNVFPLQARSRLDDPGNPGPAKLVWFSQTIGPGRGLEEFIAAWRLTGTPSILHLIGEPHEGYVKKLAALLPEGWRTRLRYHAPVPPGALPELLTSFDVGLALEPSHPRNKDLTVSNKLFQYLNAGLAVVATKTVGQREIMAAAPGAGLLIDQSVPEDVARGLDSLLTERGALRTAQRAARAAAEQKFCWEKEQPRLLEAVSHALGR